MGIAFNASRSLANGSQEIGNPSGEMTLKSFLDILVVIKFSPNYLKRILLNNSAAIRADI